MMKRILFSISVFIMVHQLHAQDAKAIIRQCNAQFASIKDYTCDINLSFDIPGLNIENIDGKVFFKKPTKFRIKTKGIVFLPKQNPNQIPQIIADTTNFIPLYIGKETVSNQLVNVVQLVPIKENEVVAAKFFINAKGQIIKAQISTKENGTSDIVNTFDEKGGGKMPANTVVSFDMKKFKIPKMIAVDINNKSARKTDDTKKTNGSVTMKFTGYKFNQKLSDDVFVN